MKRLLYLINTLETGGAQKAMVRLCGPLRNEFDIHIVGLIDGDRSLVPDLEAAGVTYTGLGFKKGLSDLGRIDAVRQVIAEFTPDILVCSLFHSSVLGAWYGRMQGVPKILSWEHSGYLGAIHRRLMKRWVDGQVDKVLCDSRFVFDVYRRAIGSDKAELMPIGGVDTSLFRPRSSSDDYDRPLVAVSVGRLEKIKGYDLLIDSAASLIAGTPNVVIRIAAVGSQKEALQNQILRRGLEKHIILEGAVKNIPLFLRGGDIYLQPSRAEGQCVAVIEAMASGLPVLAANTGGIRESVEDGVSGFLADPSDLVAWNDRFRMLLRDRQLRERMGQRGREIVLERYTLAAMVERFRNSLNVGT